MKPHSPIAECKRSPQLPPDEKKVPAATPICIGQVCRSGEIVILPPETDETIASPRKSTVEAQLRTKVTFSRVVNVKEVLHRNDMPEKVRQRYWMMEDEHRGIKLECRQTIWKMMNNDGDVDTADSTFCSRGLERRTKQGQREKMKRKEAVRRAVLSQQYLQREEGIVDFDCIAVVCSSKTKSSSDAALAAALRDAEEARLYLYGTC